MIALSEKPVVNRRSCAYQDEEIEDYPAINAQTFTQVKEN